MASRQEEKERRRAEREAAETAERSAKARTRRLQLALGTLLAVAVVVGVVIAATSGGGSSDDGGDGPASSATETVPIPAASNRNLASSAKEAGCVLRSPAIEGSTHVTTKVTYRTNPPTSGNHNPEPALDGIYDPGNTPTPEHYVHTLEHGRIEIQYKPGTPARRIEQLKTLASEPLRGKDAYKVLLFENNTDMPYAVAATAWGQMLTCKTFDDKVFDAIRNFRVRYVDKGPEQGIPPNN